VKSKQKKKSSLEIPDLMKLT